MVSNFICVKGEIPSEVYRDSRAELRCLSDKALPRMAYRPRCIQTYGSVDESFPVRDVVINEGHLDVGRLGLYESKGTVLWKSLYYFWSLCS